MESIGDRIAIARKLSNISQKELCKLTGISEPTLSRYEKNTREPKVSAIIKISEVLNVPMDYLVGITDDYRPKLKIETEGDIENILNEATNLIMENGNTFSGEVISKDDVNSILARLKLITSLTREELKESKNK